MSVRELSRFPIHLGRDATAVAEPEFTGEMNWYMSYGERHAADGNDGRLVSMYRFTESWPTWEVHPNGAEVVVCITGRMTLHQEHADGSTNTVELKPGEYVINPPGTWHTADIDGEAEGLFITAGAGTEVRPR